MTMVKLDHIWGIGPYGFWTLYICTDPSAQSGAFKLYGLIAEWCLIFWMLMGVELD